MPTLLEELYARGLVSLPFRAELSPEESGSFFDPETNEDRYDEESRP